MSTVVAERVGPTLSGHSISSLSHCLRCLILSRCWRWTLDMSCVRLSSADCSPRVDVQVPAGAAGGHRHGSYQCVIPGPGLVPTCRRPIITQALQSGSVLQTQAFLFPTYSASEKVKDIKSNGNLFVEPHNCRYLNPMIVNILYRMFSFSHPDPEPRTQPGLDQKQGHVGDQDTHLKGKYGCETKKWDLPYPGNPSANRL